MLVLILGTVVYELKLNKEQSRRAREMREMCEMLAKVVAHSYELDARTENLDLFDTQAVRTPQHGSVSVEKSE